MTTRMPELLEHKVRDLLLADPAFADIKVAYRGEPAEVPVPYFPLLIVFHQNEREPTGEDGYARQTRVIYTRHELFVGVEVVYVPTEGLVPDAQRKADVQSHDVTQDYVGVIIDVLKAWSPLADPVLGPGADERTVGRVHIDASEVLLQRRTPQAEERGNVRFHLYSRVNDF